MERSTANGDWRDFIDGPLYEDAAAPWREDPAYGFLLAFPGLRDSIGGQVAPALIQTIGLVQALARVNLLDAVQRKHPARGLSLGFGMNWSEPYDLLQAFSLDCVHGYEWIGEQVVEAAQAYQARRGTEPLLPQRLRLHHGTIRDLGVLSDGSIHVAYVANVVTPEIPMAPETLDGFVGELLRVLDHNGVVISRGSSGVLETELLGRGRMLLQMPLVAVFQKLLP
ncbi:MAG: hypothetical protein HYZ50_00900 [Deltaproteobacteria bacterium]|nr:hypothetical protein [Deltaproteobacteria bacterium]